MDCTGRYDRIENENSNKIYRAISIMHVPLIRYIKDLIHPLLCYRMQNQQEFSVLNTL